MPKRFQTVLLLLFLGLFATQGFSQEIQTRVSINTSQISGNKQIFDDMRKAIEEYMNQRKWTDMKYESYERIKVQMQLIVSQRPSVDYFRGSMQIRVIRPAYNSTYETITFNYKDPSFNFRFVQFTQLQFSENQYIDNLTCMLNFYAYMILGIDQASFQKDAGIPYFQKAQNMVNLGGNNSSESGWQSFEDNKNRYWVANNLINSSYSKYHEIYYNWHRKGIDVMEKDVNKGRGVILQCLKDLQKLNRSNPGLIITRVIMDAKSNEIVGVFGDALDNEKRQVITILEDLDPGNLQQYNKILEGK